MVLLAGMVLRYEDDVNITNPTHHKVSAYQPTQDNTAGYNKAQHNTVRHQELPPRTPDLPNEKDVDTYYNYYEYYGT